jgi:putative redox protein
MTQVQVKAKAAGEFKQEIKTESHSLVSDAPKSVGGGETGPNPHELMLASLGSCTNITLQMYAKKKGWELKGVTIDLTEDQVDDPQNPGKKISQITRNIQVQGDFNDEQIEGLKGAAERCPIHKLLSGSSKIDTVLKN